MHSAKPLRPAPDIVRDIMRLRDHLWEKVGGRSASDPLAWVALQINSALYSGMPPVPHGWNYDLTDIPVKPGFRFLGLWHHGPPPKRDETQIIWRSTENSFLAHGLRYLTEAGNEAPHYVRDPHAWALLPEIRSPHGR
jgi:hypothetical protein